MVHLRGGASGDQPCPGTPRARAVHARRVASACFASCPPVGARSECWISKFVGEMFMPGRALCRRALSCCVLPSATAGSRVRGTIIHGAHASLLPRHSGSAFVWLPSIRRLAQDPVPDAKCHIAARPESTWCRSVVQAPPGRSCCQSGPEQYTEPRGRVTTPLRHRSSWTLNPTPLGAFHDYETLDERRGRNAAGDVVLCGPPSVRGDTLASQNVANSWLSVPPLAACRPLEAGVDPGWDRAESAPRGNNPFSQRFFA